MYLEHKDWSLYHSANNSKIHVLFKNIEIILKNHIQITHFMYFSGEVVLDKMFYYKLAKMSYKRNKIMFSEQYVE